MQTDKQKPGSSITGFSLWVPTSSVMTESTMPSARLSTTFPLLLTTAIGLLATDLYLPAIPIIADRLEASVEHAQYTLVAFFAAFSAFQLVYGALAQRFNAGTILALAIVLLAIGSLIGALAQSIETLIAARLIQGVGASAGAAIVPGVVRRLFDQRTSVRVISVFGVFESCIPALAPIVGAGMVVLLGWRSTFWALTVVAILSCILLLRMRDKTPPVAGDRSHDGFFRQSLTHYGAVLRNARFVTIAGSYASAFGALMLFVGTAPQVLDIHFGRDMSGFVLMQLVMVAAFMAGSLAAPSFIERYGLAAANRIGVIMLAVTTAGLFLIYNAQLPQTAQWYVAVLLPSQIGLGLRFGGSMTEAIGACEGREAAASAMSAFLCFVFAAIGNALAAPFVEASIAPIVYGSLVFAVASVAAHLASLRTVPARPSPHRP